MSVTRYEGERGKKCLCVQPDDKNGRGIGITLYLRFLCSSELEGETRNIYQRLICRSTKKKIMSRVDTTFYNNRPIHAGSFIMRDLLAGQTFSHIFRVREIYLFGSRRSLSLRTHVQFVRSVSMRRNCCSVLSFSLSF